MTTPTYVNSPYRVLQQAYFEAGLTEEGQDPNGEQLARGINRLNDVLNLYQTQGLRLWLQFDLAITPTAGVNLYKMGTAANGGTVIMTRPTRVLEGYYQDSNLNNRPLIPLSRNEWDTLSQYSTQGQISNYFVDKQVPTMNVYFWLTPDAQAATGTAHVIIQQQQPNAVSLVDTLNFGPEWFLFLVWEMAAQLSRGQPLAVQQRCIDAANKYREMLENWDVEDTPTSFAPDSRGQYVGSKFT